VTATNAGPQQALRQEIIADAKLHAERVLGHARQEARNLREKSRQEIEKDTRERLEAARRDAENRRELLLASVILEASRRREARTEAVLQGVLDEARRRILAREGFDYREAVVRFAAEAIGRMEGASFVLQLSDADRQAIGAGLAEEVCRRVGREGLQVAVDGAGAKIDGGVIVRDAEGRQVWDNSLLARLGRFWPILRREIGDRTSLAGTAEHVGRGAAPAPESPRATLEAGAAPRPTAAEKES